MTGTQKAGGRGEHTTWHVPEAIQSMKLNKPHNYNGIATHDKKDPVKHGRTGDLYETLSRLPRLVRQAAASRGL